MSRTQSSLPAKRAFVVQVHAKARVEQHDFKGRVEHLVSGEATRFDSLEELIAFIVQTLGVVSQRRHKRYGLTTHYNRSGMHHERDVAKFA